MTYTLRRQGCQVPLQFKGRRLPARHSPVWAGACIAEEVALAAVTGTLGEGCLLPWVRSHMHGNFLSVVRGSVENLVVRKRM